MNEQKATESSMAQKSTASLAIIDRTPAERAVIALDSTKTEAHLKELVGASASIKEVIDPAGRAQAHRAAMDLKNARVAINNAGKTAREDAQSFAKAVIAEEKRLITITEDEEKRLFGLRDAYDEKIAREVREAEEREAVRVGAIKERIATILMMPSRLASASSMVIHAALGDLAAINTAQGFQGYEEQVTTTIDTVAGALVELRAAAQAREQAEIQRQRDQEEERKRLAEQAEENRIAAEKLAAERAEMERAAREREAAQQEERLRAALVTQATVIINDMRNQASNAQGSAYELHRFLNQAEIFKCDPRKFADMAQMVDMGKTLAVDMLQARIRQESDKEAHDAWVEAHAYNIAIDLENQVQAVPSVEEIPEKAKASAFDKEPDSILSLRAAVRWSLTVFSAEDILATVSDEIAKADKFGRRFG